MAEPMPAKPAEFTAAGAPPGVEVRFVTFAASRPIMREAPRLQLVHTNAAAGEGTIESAWNWAHAKPGVNTIPHYQIDRQVGRSGYIARKMLPSNRVGIANATVDAYQGGRGDVREWSLAYETADLGYGAGKPGDESGFSAEQAEVLAQVLAYESITHGIPLEPPAQWYGAGTGGHTAPFTYPYWTMFPGKSCPGRRKLEQLWGEVLPRARRIRAAWTNTTTPIPTPTPGDDEMPRKVLCRLPDGRMICTDLYSYSNYCTEDEGARLRDQEAAEVIPDGVAGGSGPWPVYDPVQASYLQRLTDR